MQIELEDLDYQHRAIASVLEVPGQLFYSTQITALSSYV
jgi:hypothetical protein